MKTEHHNIEEMTIEAFAEKHNLTMEVHERERAPGDSTRFYAHFKRPTASAQEPLFGTWSDVESAVPDTLTPVIVWGILEGEDTPASHEGFRSRTCWRSVRTNEDCGDRLKINIPTHWMPMPDAPPQTLTPP